MRESVKYIFTTVKDTLIVSLMGNRFGQAISGLLSDKGLSQRDFAALVGMSQPNISKLLRGDPRTPPPMREVIEEWCKKLDAKNTAAILDLAEQDLVEQSRQEVQKMVRRQELELASLRKKVSDLEGKALGLEHDLISLGAELSRLRDKKTKPS